jgi:hypothetical protein
MAHPCHALHPWHTRESGHHNRFKESVAPVPRRNHVHIGKATLNMHMGQAWSTHACIALKGQTKCTAVTSTEQHTEHTTDQQAYPHPPYPTVNTRKPSNKQANWPLRPQRAHAQNPTTPYLIPPHLTHSHSMALWGPLKAYAVCMEVSSVTRIKMSGNSPSTKLRQVATAAPCRPAQEQSRGQNCTQVTIHHVTFPLAQTHTQDQAVA